MMVNNDYEVIGDSADRAAWLKARQLGIGASEMAAVMGVSKWESALSVYARKVGALQTADEEVSEACYWGSALERLIAQRWSAKTGNPYEWKGWLMRSYGDVPWAIATLDAQASVRDGDIWRLNLPLECKTANQYLASEWRDGAPEAYRIQVHHQMLVTGASTSIVACLIGGQTFVWDRVDRDEALIRRIVRAGNEFWQRVQNREPPPPDGSESSIEALEALYPDHDGDVDLDSDMLAVDEVRQDAAAKIKQLEVIRDRANAALRAAIGGAKRGRLPNGVTYTISQCSRPEYVVKANTYTQMRRSAPKERR